MTKTAPFPVTAEAVAAAVVADAAADYDEDYDGAVAAAAGRDYGVVAAAVGDAEQNLDC